MADVQLNDQIFEAIKELTADDALTREFLVHMLMEEYAHPGLWRFREEYKRQIGQYSHDWSGEQ